MAGIINFDKAVNKNVPKIKEPLPQVDKGGFLLLLIGPRGSGKTNLLLNLMKKDMLGSAFKPKYTVLFSPSLNVDESLEEIKADWRFDQFDDDIISDIIDQQKEIKNEFGKSKLPNVLIILDDCASESNTFKARGTLELLAMRGRHLNISIIATSQKLSSVCRGIRLNATNLIIYEPHNGSEIDFILSEYATKSNKKKFEAMMNDIFSEPYSFLYINLQTKDRSKRYYRNFDAPYILQSF